MSIFTKIQNPELDGVWGFAPIEGKALKLPKYKSGMHPVLESLISKSKSKLIQPLSARVGANKLSDKSSSSG
jgi:hypothetical protein